ncbi:AlpA family phage regulatory protein [Methylopila sp. 73B]|uniref:helix-turn-helix transcriptional regulator n=1 Tax=Methylopila sp. 73B TaxID=1120792 RepID=UPI000372E038|nr:AlpA family phage regulatory protein [Methylopila sp. 73B]
MSATIDLENDRLLKIAEVSHRTGLAPSTIYKKMDTAGFPKPVKLGTRTVRWWQSAVVAWLSKQIGD